MNIDFDVLLAAITSAGNKAAVGQEVHLKHEFSAVPVPVRLILAAITLAAAGQRMTGANLAAAGGLSRGSTLRDYGHLVAVVKDAVPHLVRVQLGSTQAGPSATELATELQLRDETIARLRKSLRDQKQALDVVQSYARDLHEQLRPELEAIVAEKSAKVRPLRSIDPNRHRPD